MDFALDDDEQLIVDTVRRFAEQLRGWSADADRAGAAPDRFTKAARELGLLDAPDETFTHSMRALRGFELGRGCAGLAAVIEGGVEAALVAAKYGIEIGAGVLATRETAFVPGLATATHVVLATGDGLFVGVPTEVVAKTPSGWRAAGWASARIVDKKQLGDADAAREVLSWARVSLAARAAGVATAAMAYAEAYAKERVQFGQPIGTFESLIRLRDDAMTTAHAARLCALEAAWALDKKRADAHDLASRARVIAGDAVTRATIDAVQIFGGYGFVNDYPVEKLMRDARAFEALHGDERLGRVLAQKAAS